MRVALYARVSTEEQVKHGISIDAQINALRAWATAQGHYVVGEYVEEGVSARKSPHKRPELSRLLHDIPQLQTELVAFTKLDRWTRNIAGYYKVQEILDKYSVAWCAIQEDYETATASGRMKVNIMLCVAENEADRTSERIKAVYAHKVALGQPINGNVPVGLTIDGKRIVPDEYAPAVVAAFQSFADTGNRGAVQQTLDGYGKHLSLQSIDRLLRNRLYIGEYRDNPNYCEPILDRELFDRVQHDIAVRYTRRAPTGQVYLFAGLVFCGVCGRRMSGIHPRTNRQSYYHCQTGHCNLKDCHNSTYIREDIIEGAVVDALAKLVMGKAKQAKPPKNRQSNKAEIERKLSRLKDLYIDGDLTRQQYKLRRDQLAAMIRPQEKSRPKTIFGDDFLTAYSSMTAPQKQALFRNTIEKVVASESGEIDVFFADLSLNSKARDDNLP